MVSNATAKSGESLNGLQLQRTKQFGLPHPHPNSSSIILSSKELISLKGPLQFIDCVQRVIDASSAQCI